MGGLTSRDLDLVARCPGAGMVQVFSDRTQRLRVQIAKLTSSR